MSFPAFKSKGEFVTEPSFKEGPYGVPDVLTRGPQAARSVVADKHPLEISEKKYMDNQSSFELGMMRHVQGIHAPMRLAMERQAVSKVQRLPMLPSSHLLLDALTGKDDTIEFEDIFNNREFEPMVMPHVVMEKSLGVN